MFTLSGFDQLFNLALPNLLLNFDDLIWFGGLEDGETLLSDSLDTLTVCG